MTDQIPKPGPKSTMGKPTQSPIKRLSAAFSKEGKQAIPPASAAATTSVSNEIGGGENSNAKGTVLPPLGDVSLIDDTPHKWARTISQTVEKELGKIQAEAERKTTSLNESYDPWKAARDKTRSLFETNLNRDVLNYLELEESGVDCHSHWIAPVCPSQLQPLADLADSQLQKDSRLMETLSPAEFQIWKMRQPGCYWYFCAVLMQCNVSGEDWLGVMRAAQEDFEEDEIKESFLE